MLEVEEPETPAETQDNGPDASTSPTTAPTARGVHRAGAREPRKNSPRSPSRARPTGKTCRKRGPPKRRRVPSRRPRSSTRTAPRRRCATTCCGSSSSRILTRGPRRSARRSSTRSTTTATSRTISTRSARLSRPTCVVTVEEVEKVLVGLVQQFDPAGIGARNVSECVLLQLAQLAPDTVGPRARAHDRDRALCRSIAERQYRCAQAAAAKCPTKSSQSAIALVRSCHPRPGSAVFAPAVGLHRAGRVRATQRRPVDRRAEQRGLAAATGESSLCGLARQGRGV